MSHMSDRISRALDNHGYRLIKKIGEGSFGPAVLVQCKANDQKMFAKLIDLCKGTQKEHIDALKEGQALTKFKHPYIVRYSECFFEQGWLCFAVEFCKGGDLGTRIHHARKSSEMFAESQVTRWFTQALLALKYIHDLHILHRDLKTSNFFLSSSGSIKLGDFGIAKAVECTAACARTQVGTPYYLSPEICQGKPYGRGSDIWAMGCVLFEICAKRVPFDAPNIASLVQKIVRGSTPQLPMDYSTSLRETCNDMLNRNPGQRPEAAEMLKRPMIQEMVKVMLQELQEAGNSNEAARGSVTSDAGASAKVCSAAYASFAGTYAVDDPVQYSSATHKQWLPAKVTAVDANGRIQVTTKPKFWISLEMQAQKVRPSGSTHCAGTYAVDDRVQFFDLTKTEWFSAKVVAVDESGCIQMDVKPNVWMSVELQAEQVRPSLGQARRSVVPSILARDRHDKVRPSVSSSEGQHDPLLRPTAVGAVISAEKQSLSLDERRQICEESKRIGGRSGADHLHSMLPARYWGISREQLHRVVAQVLDAGLLNRTPIDLPPYDQSRFDSAGPNIHQLNNQFIKPRTDKAARPLPLASYCLLLNHVAGLECDLFVSHAWDEGFFEFSKIVLDAWPGDCTAAYICCFSNPQNLDIGKLMRSPKETPFHRVLESIPKCMLIAANSNTPVHSRLWCCYEAFCAWEISVAFAREEQKAPTIDGLDLSPEERAIRIQISGNPLHLLPAGRCRDQAEQIMKQHRMKERRGLNKRVVDLTIAEVDSNVQLVQLLQKINIDVGKARCTNAADEKRIKTEIQGDETAVNNMIKKLVYDALSGIDPSD